MSGQIAFSTDGPDRRRMVLRPNHSLSIRGMVVLLLSLLGSSLIIGAVFLMTGAWPVVPFLFLELMTVGLVLFLVRRRAEDYEAITVDGDRLEIVKRQGKNETHHTFQRYWARVSVEPGRGGWYPSRLFIRSHGHGVEIGARFCEEERQALARDLKRIVGPDYRRSANAPYPAEFMLMRRD